jgi:hypothetical protein
MMTLRESIEFDVQALKRYFQQLFVLIKQLSDASAEPTEETYVGDLTAFVRPDMACNIYSLVDFWLARLADFHQKRGDLPLTYRDIKARNDFDVYHKYFTKVAGLPLDSLSSSLDQLNNLRKVRNCLIHRGAHVDAQQASEIEAIPNISLFGTLVLMADEFIWNCLEHASLYLCAVCEARPAP